MNPPRKPFPSYKWRWATLECTEGLNAPPVFLGVLRALAANEGRAPNSIEFHRSLKVIESDVQTRVSLARSLERNLIRHSGQYWKGPGLLEDDPGVIRLTPLGRRVADGSVSPTEFAVVTIKTLELPNPRIERNLSEWRRVDLRIKPLELLLGVMAGLASPGGQEAGYITVGELISIVIPLAGNSASVSTHVAAIEAYRNGRLDISEWPDCAPGANDLRIAREFLLFLEHYGFCRSKDFRNRAEQRFYLCAAQSDVSDLLGLSDESRVASAITRQWVLQEVLSRPEQPKFRREVLRSCKGRCLVTSYDLPGVLEAAHIVPARDNGPDTVDNGLCLRSDIHLLFDCGHLRIGPDGDLHLSDAASTDRNYASLPQRICIPGHIDRDRLQWRWKYC